MSKIRHIAVTTNDLESSAEFYKGAFDLEEISRNDEAVILTDGYIVFALLEFKADRYGGGRPGLHHFGIKIEDMNAVEDKMSALGGQEMVEYNRTYGNREGTEDNWVGREEVDGPPRGGLRHQPDRMGLSDQPLGAVSGPHTLSGKLPHYVTRAVRWYHLMGRPQLQTLQTQRRRLKSGVVLL